MIQRALRLFFKHLYTDAALLYDTVAWISSMGQWRTWQSVVFEHLRPGTVLELGQGPGHVQLDLNKAGYKSVAIDPSRQMCNIAQMRLSRSGYNAKQVRGIAQGLPFPGQTFDNVVATFPSEYILAGGTLQEISRVLRNDGRLIVAISVEITGRSIPDRFSSYLYRITGQSGASPLAWEARFLEQGLRSTAVQVDLPRARVQCIIAQSA